MHFRITICWLHCAQARKWNTWSNRKRRTQNFSCTL